MSPELSVEECEHAFVPGFVAFVNDLLEQIPYNGYFHSLEKW